MLFTVTVRFCVLEVRKTVTVSQMGNRNVFLERREFLRIFVKDVMLRLYCGVICENFFFKSYFPPNNMTDTYVTGKQTGKVSRNIVVLVYLSVMEIIVFYLYFVALHDSRIRI